VLQLLVLPVFRLSTKKAAKCEAACRLPSFVKGAETRPEDSSDLASKTCAVRCAVQCQCGAMAVADARLLRVGVRKQAHRMECMCEVAQLTTQLEARHALCVCQVDAACRHVVGHLAA
jgi:hypothetical protein